MPTLPPNMSQPPHVSVMDMNAPPSKSPRVSTEFPAAHTNGQQPSSPAYGPPLGSANLVSYQLPPSPYQSFNTPQSPYPSNMDGVQGNQALQSKPATGTMGPPEKPQKERATDINDLSDLVFSAGVDLKEEENYLTAAYTNKRAPQPATSFNSSFHNSQGSSQTLTPESSFSQWKNSQTAIQLPNAARPSGPTSQPTIKPDDLEDNLAQKHKLAARHQAESRQKHLNDPFLLANVVRQKMHTRTYTAQVRLRTDGLVTETPKPSVTVSATQLNDGSAVVSAKATTLNENSTLVDILSLLSLACQERLRSVLEDTYAISRARVYGSGGVVPPEFADIAVGSSKPEVIQVKSESVTGTAWDASSNGASMNVKTLKRKTFRTCD